MALPASFAQVLADPRGLGQVVRPDRASRSRSTRPAPGARSLFAGGLSGLLGCGRVGAIFLARNTFLPRSSSCSCEQASCSRGSRFCSSSSMWCRMSLVNFPSKLLLGHRVSHQLGDDVVGKIGLLASHGPSSNS